MKRMWQPLKAAINHDLCHSNGPSLLYSTLAPLVQLRIAGWPGDISLSKLKAELFHQNYDKTAAHSKSAGTTRGVLYPQPVIRLQACHLDASTATEPCAL